MRLDSTFVNRTTENTQDTRKILQRLGETAGISRTHAREISIEGNRVSALNMFFADIQVVGCQVGDTVEVGGPRDLPPGLTVTGVVLEADWVQLRAANNTSRNIYMPGRDWKVITRGFGDG